MRLAIGADETKHFNSDDLEGGNPGKGLAGATGSGEGDWRLALTSGLDIEVLGYIRTEDGFLTAMHDVAPAGGGGTSGGDVQSGEERQSGELAAGRQSRRQARRG